MRRIWILLVVGLVVAACGGGSDTQDDGGGTDAPTATEAPAATPAPAPADDSGTDTTTAPPTDDAPADSGGTVGHVSVTVGDETYEADIDLENILQRCDPDFFGALWALGSGIEIFLPPEGDPNHTDPQRIMVKDEENDLEWVADPSANRELVSSVPEGDSQVDSFLVEGTTATGTATFVEQNAVYAWNGGTEGQPEPVQGTFEVTCPAK